MLSRVGDRIAAARQSQGITLEALAQRLHLGVHQLDALERGDRARLPEVVFVIAQARRVAASLAIDIEPELADLRASTVPKGGRALVRSGVEFDPAVGRRRSAGSSVLRPAAIILAVAGLAVAMASLLSGSLLKRLSVPSSVLAGSGRPADLPSSPRPPVQAIPGGAPAATAVEPPRSGAGKPAAPGSPAAAETLLLSSSPASWVSVRDRSGRSLFAGTLSGERRFPIGQGLEVLAGRPDLVQASLGAQPHRPLGPISQVEWRRFDPPTTPAAPAAAAPPAAVP